MNSIIEYFGAKPDSQEKPKAIERTPSGTKKWVKELSPLANNVVGRCARFEFLSLLRYFLILAKPEAIDVARIDARLFYSRQLCKKLFLVLTTARNRVLLVCQH